MTMTSKVLLTIVSTILLLLQTSCAFQVSVVFGQTSIGCDWQDGYAKHVEGATCIAGGALSAQGADAVGSVADAAGDVINHLTPQGAASEAVEGLND
jgi:hypothetical protein